MAKFDENMESFFNVEPTEKENLPVEYKEKTPALFDNLERDLKTDYEKSRDNIEELIEKGTMALDDILAIARESERGRDFEVAATMLKTVLDANESVMNLHKKVRDLSNYKAQENNTTIKNAVFVGSTNELAKMVKDLNNKKVIDVTPE